MSNFFTKNNLSEIFKDFKNENIKGLPCYNFMPQKDIDVILPVAIGNFKNAPFSLELQSKIIN